MNGQFTKMKNRRCEHSACAPFFQALQKMLKIARSTGSNNGNLDGCATCRVNPGRSPFCAVRIHAREKDFAGSEFRDALRPLDGIQVRAISAAVRIDLGPLPSLRASIATTMHWLPKRSAASRTSRALHGLRVQRNLVGAGAKDRLNVVDDSQAAPTVKGY
jgi:hypothetical protein